MAKGKKPRLTQKQREKLYKWIFLSCVFLFLFVTVVVFSDVSRYIGRWYAHKLIEYTEIPKDRIDHYPSYLTRKVYDAHGDWVASEVIDDIPAEALRRKFLLGAFLFYTFRAEKANQEFEEILTWYYGDQYSYDHNDRWIAYAGEVSNLDNDDEKRKYIGQALFMSAKCYEQKTQVMWAKRNFWVMLDNFSDVVPEEKIKVAEDYTAP